MQMIRHIGVEAEFAVDDNIDCRCDQGCDSTERALSLLGVPANR
jgi:hypothetical protein